MVWFKDARPSIRKRLFLPPLSVPCRCCICAPYFSFPPHHSVLFAAERQKKRNKNSPPPTLSKNNKKRSPNWCPETLTDECDCFKTVFDAWAWIVIELLIEDQFLPCPLNRIKAALLFQCSEESMQSSVLFLLAPYFECCICYIYTTTSSSTWITTEGTLVVCYREHKIAQTERKFLLYYSTASNPVFPDCCYIVCC